jgi:hypothetical protein
MTFTYHTEDTLKGTITVPEDRRFIFTSIPYDKGWRVTCDGKEVETAEILDALLSFALPAGEHEVTLEYKPDSVKLGNIISVAGLAAFVLIAVGNRMLIKRSDEKEDAAVPATDEAPKTPEAPEIPDSPPESEKNDDDEEETQ